MGEWISVKEKLPERGVLVLVSGGDWVDAAMFQFSGDLYPLFRHGSGYTSGDVTHWMPLPSPPDPPTKDGE